MNILLSKGLWYASVFLVVVAAVVFFLNDWHYRPLKKKDLYIVSLEKQLKIVSSAVNTCENNLTAQSLNGFIEGIGEDNEIHNIDLNNLHT